MKATHKLRHAWRWLSDGNGEVKVLILQQWHEVEGWEHDDHIKAGGEWQNIEVDNLA